MTRTCVYGHRWTKGGVTCPTCGIRALGTQADLTPLQDEARAIGTALVWGCVAWLVALVGMAVWAVLT